MKTKFKATKNSLTLKKVKIDTNEGMIKSYVEHKHKSKKLPSKDTSNRCNKGHFLHGFSP